MYLQTLLPLLLTGALLPGQVLVVDINGGPGTNYTSLVTAAAQAPNGATLVVRRGSYPGIVTISGKGLEILAEPFVNIVFGGVAVQNTQPDHVNVLRGLNILDLPTQMFGAVRVSNCAGPVVLDRLVATPSPYPSSSVAPPAGLVITGSSQVLVRDSTVNQLGASSSQVVLEGCTINGRSANLSGGLLGTWTSTPAITAGGGEMQIAHSTVQGGWGACPLFQVCSPGQVPIPPWHNQPALVINAIRVVVRSPSTVSGGANAGQAAAVVGSGMVRIDPAVVLNGTVSVSPPALTVPMPTGRSTDASLGGTILGSGTGPPRDTLVLVVGLPGSASIVPGIIDPFWLDPAAHFFAAIGVAQSTAPLTSSVAVPNDPAWLGFRVAWQTVSYGPAAGLQASQPSVAVVY